MQTVFPSQMQYPVVDPDNIEGGSDLLKALIAHQYQPAEWVWTPITDWSGDEAKAIRYEVSGLLEDRYVNFRAAVYGGRRGTAMHLVTKAGDLPVEGEPSPATDDEDPPEIPF